jgi:UDP-2,3-diacylglucosamine pyrophosphatase LpxH
MTSSSLCRIALTVVTAVGAICVHEASSQTNTGSSRQRVFISDLHMGVGRQADGRWSNFEDFRWAPEFRAFLDEIDRAGNGATDLVIVGDAFELWQSTTDDCIYPEKDFGCTEVDAMARMSRIVANHSDELAALGAFAKMGANHVVFVPGNHDAALLFDGVAQMAQAAMDAGAAVEVNRTGAWISPDSAIYAEHGHEIGKEVNRFDGWPHPFVGRPPHLQRPWGEQFVQHYYNRFESKYPIIDNILSEGVGVHYAMKAEGLTETAADIGRLVNFFVTKLSWAQFSGSVGGGENSRDWDVERVRQQGDRFFIESLPPNDPLRSAADQAAKEHVLGLSIQELTDDDIREICDARAALNAAEPKVKLVSAPERCPRRTAGALTQRGLRRSRDAILREHLQKRSQELKQAQPGASEFQLFVFGHTHQAEDAFRPMQGTGSDWQPVAINTGAWQRVIEPVDLEEWRGARAEAAVLTAQPEELPPCYSLVVVGPYAAKPTPRLRYWTLRNGRWQLAESCRWTPPNQ